MMANFIMLPDGTIINVESIDSVIAEDGFALINTFGKYGAVVHDDPDGKIYAWFADRAVPVGGVEVSRTYGELCYKCNGARSGNHDEKCPHCGEMWAPF